MRQSQRGVTLVEMVIVLMILLSLSGVAISLYPDIALRANLTGSLATVQELNNNFQLLETLTIGGMPDNLDLLTDIPVSTGAVGDVGLRAAVAAELETTGGLLTAFTSADIALLLDPTGLLVVAADVEAAFAAKGCDSFAIQDTTGAPAPVINQTFDFPGAPDLTPIGLSTFYLVDDATLLADFNIIADDVDAADLAGTAVDAVYVLLGVGNRASHVGSPPGLMVAPVYVPDVSKTSALITAPTEASTKDFYSRYMVIYKVEAVGTAEVLVSFVACTYPHPTDGLSNMSELMRKLQILD